MNLDHFQETEDLVKQNPNLSGFDLYYMGFFLFHAPELSPKGIHSLVHRIFELYQNETISIQEKIKSLVRVLSKKIDVEVIQELKLAIKDENENKIALRDYFSQISDLLPQYGKLSKIDLFYFGFFHAKLPSYRISDLLKHINSIKEVMEGSLSDEESRINFLLKILNNKLKETHKSLNTSTHSNFTTSNSGAHKTERPEVQNSNIQKESPKRRGLKRDNSTNLEDYDHELKKVKKGVTPSESQDSRTNHTTRNTSNLHSLAEDESPFNDNQNSRHMTEENNSNTIKEEFSHKNLGLKRMTTEDEEELSRALIEKLQQDEKEEREKLQAKLEAQNSVNCAICLDDLYAVKFKPLATCSHVFHEECMKEYLQAKIDEKGFPILCPELECKSEITLGDVIEFMDDKYREKFESFSFKSYLEKNANEVSCCPTADCPFAFVKEEDQSQLQCPVCHKHYCLNCRVIWHKGMTCKEYEISSKKDENDVKFEKFVKGQQFKQCPKCGFWVSRTEGCNAMICRCRTQFCYNCGKEGDGHVCPCLQKAQPNIALNRRVVIPPVPAPNLFANNMMQPTNLFANNMMQPMNLFANTVRQPMNLFNNLPQNNMYYPNNVFYNQNTVQNTVQPKKVVKRKPKKKTNKKDWLVGEEPSDADTLGSDDD